MWNTIWSARVLLRLRHLWLFLLVPFLAVPAGTLASRLPSGGNSSLDKHPETFQVFSVDYSHVLVPFEIALWIMLASLAKLGDTDAFFLFLLPPIVMDAGYFLPGWLFFNNLGTILLYAVPGTLWNALAIGYLLYGLCLVLPGTALEGLSLSHCSQFGSLISTVDPVAMLPVFEEMHVNECWWWASSSAWWPLVTRFTARAQVITPLFVFLFSYRSYLTSEMLHISGIMVIISCAVSRKQYVEANISEKSHTTIKYFLKMWSSLSETLIFIFLGVSIIQDKHMWNWPFVACTLVLCLVCRVLLLTAVINRVRHNQVTFRDQFIIAYGGLRGAICFSLVFLMDDFKEAPHYHHHHCHPLHRLCAELLEVQKKSDLLSLGEEIQSRDKKPKSSLVRLYQKLVDRVNRLSAKTKRV
ncbi:hypothetical protein ACEWY4_027267 [Coilia grayii]|uniref:Cation/H+ exchanger transmembrane domain-containing protein n=1 Tax=Coilia grayii TaxID=363190 RepID=A0ABD1IW07_9TELE